MRELGMAAFAAMLLTGTSAFAADGAWKLHDAVGAPKALTLNGAVRVRYEALDGQVRPGFGTGEDYLVVRTNLFAEYRTGPIRIGGELYDSRAYGADRGGVLSTSDVNTFEPVQAYVAADLGPLFGARSSANVQLGRMTLNLGSRRLVAADDYRNTTNGYTGVKFEGKAAGGLGVSLIYVEPQVRLPDDIASLRDNEAKLDRESDDLVLWGGIASKAGLPDKATLELEYFELNEDDVTGRPTRNRNLHTFGARLVRAPEAGHVDYEFEGFRQTGSIRTSTAPAAAVQGVRAGFAHAEVGYQFADGWKSHLAFEYDQASGDNAGGRYNRFDTLFGMRRADYAPAGLFNAIARANSRVLGARFEATPTPRWDVMGHYARLALDSRTDAFSTTGVRDPSGRSGEFAGQLVEARVRYWLVPSALRLETNALLLDKGRFLHEAPNAPRTDNTRYVAVALTASF